MESNHHPPQFRAECFNCPHCTAYAQQKWQCERYVANWVCRYQFQLFLDYRKKAWVTPDSDKAITSFLSNEDIKRKIKELPVREDYFTSECSHCKNLAIWINKEMVYPLISSAPPPNEDMPEDVRKVYEEARQVQPFSPRATVALLRVALEELTNELGESEGSLYDRILKLQERGLPKQITQHADTIRKIGNKGAHAGQIDLTEEDDEETGNILFSIMNVIVVAMITLPEKADSIHKHLLSDKEEETKNRDDDPKQ